MKMMCCSGVFWGLLLILFGILIIIKYVFHIDFPVFKIVVALFFIYLGIKILFGTGGGKCGMKNNNSSVFSESTFSYSSQQNKYDVVFGKANLDLSDIQLNENKFIELNSVFSEFRVKIDKTTNFEILSNTVFGNISIPNNNNANFGTSAYRSENYDSSQPLLQLKVNVVFGNVVIAY